MSLIDFRALSLVQEYLEVLACIIRADGRYAAAEMDVLQAAFTGSGLSPGVLDQVRGVLDPARPVNIDSVLRSATRGASPALLAELLRDGYVMASIDGEISAPEVAVLDRLLVLAGVAEARRPELHQWARTAAAHHLHGLRLLREALPPAPVAP